MIKIAVADDDRIVCQELKLLIDKFAVKYDYNIVCMYAVYLIHAKHLWNQ